MGYIIMAKGDMNGKNSRILFTLIPSIICYILILCKYSEYKTKSQQKRFFAGNLTA